MTSLELLKYAIGTIDGSGMLYDDVSEVKEIRIIINGKLKAKFCGDKIEECAQLCIIDLIRGGMWALDKKEELGYEPKMIFHRIKLS